MQILKVRYSAMKISFFVILLTAALSASASDAPGSIAKGYELRGDRLTARFKVTNGSIKLMEVEDLRVGQNCVRERHSPCSFAMGA